MLCPQCSEPRPLNEAKFCKRCGYKFEAVGVDSEGSGGPTASNLSPRQKGVRLGVKLMLLSIVLIPAYVLLAALFPARDTLVESHVSDTPFEKISQAVLFTIFMLGLARTLYAYLFEKGVASEEQVTQETAELKGESNQKALPPSHSIPVSGFGAWRANTGEVVRPAPGAPHNPDTRRE